MASSGPPNPRNSSEQPRRKYSKDVFLLYPDSVISGVTWLLNCPKALKDIILRCLSKRGYFTFQSVSKSLSSASARHTFEGLQGPDPLRDPYEPRLPGSHRDSLRSARARAPTNPPPLTDPDIILCYFSRLKSPPYTLDSAPLPSLPNFSSRVN